MKKVKLMVTEELKYEREVIAEAPDGMTDDQLEKALDRAQSGADSVDEFVGLLSRFGIVVNDAWDDSMNSPDFGEVECDDYEWISGPEDTEATE